MDEDSKREDEKEMQEEQYYQENFGPFIGIVNAIAISGIFWAAVAYVVFKVIF